MRLRIESPDGLPANEYRLVNGHAEFRVLPPRGCLDEACARDWKTLDENDIEMHYALQTVVWEWLEVRVGTHSTAPNRAD